MKMLKLTVSLVLLMCFVFSMDVMAKRRKGSPESIYDFEANEPVNGIAIENRGKLYFRVQTDTTNEDGSITTTYALWLSGGSDAEEVYSFDEGSLPYNFASNRGKLYFVVQTTTTVTNEDGSTTTTVNDVLWVSDGTEDGTEAVMTFDSSVSLITALVSNRGKLYFGTSEDTTNEDGSTTTTNSLWVSDGTEDGTEAYYTFESTERIVTSATSTKGKLFFVVGTTTTNDDGSTTYVEALWVSDGTEDGTEAFYDFESGTVTTSNITTTKGKLYFFVATTTTNDDGSTTTVNSLWVSDGDEEAESIHDFDSTVSPTVGSMMTTKGKLFFAATTTTTNEDGSTTTTDSLWISDGDDDTEAAYDLESGQSFSSGFTTTKGKLFFIIENVATNDDGSTTTTYQFWTSDSKGDAEVVDDSYDSTQYLYNIGNARGKVFYFVENTVTAEDGSVSRTYELYVY